ncbi:MAG: dethiobiotin synthase, partial [Dokdonella sp.]
MSASVYVTGTDTGIGKTHVSRILIERSRARGVSTLGMKPVSSGCRLTAHGLRNDDAELLRAFGSVEAHHDDINPYAFEPPIAPHIAAREAAVSIDLMHIDAAYRRLAAQADAVIVEG